MRTWFWRATFEDKNDPETIHRIRGGTIEAQDYWDEETVESWVKERLWDEYGLKGNECIVYVEPDDDHNPL